VTNNLCVVEAVNLENCKTDDRMRCGSAKTAFRYRAGLEFARFLRQQNRLPDNDEFETILHSGLNRVAKRIFEWRTGKCAKTGRSLAMKANPVLADELTRLYDGACRRECFLRKACFPGEAFEVVYFKPNIH